MDLSLVLRVGLQAGRMGEGMIDVSILMTFNKLKLMAKKASLTEDEAKATVSPYMYNRTYIQCVQICIHRVLGYCRCAA